MKDDIYRDALGVELESFVAINKTFFAFLDAKESPEAFEKGMEYYAIELRITARQIAEEDPTLQQMSKEERDWVVDRIVDNVTLPTKIIISLMKHMFPLLRSVEDKITDPEQIKKCRELAQVTHGNYKWAAIQTSKKACAEDLSDEEITRLIKRYTEFGLAVFMAELAKLGVTFVSQK